MKDVVVYIRAFNPRNRNGYIMQYVVFFVFEYNGVLKYDAFEVEADSLADVRLMGVEYILKKLKEPCNVIIRSLTKIKYNPKNENPLIKNIQNIAERGGHNWEVEVVHESDYPILKELKSKSNKYKQELIEKGLW